MRDGTETQPGVDGDIDDAVDIVLRAYRPAVRARAMHLLALVYRFYLRAQTEDANLIPSSGGLVVSNHSGGLLSTDYATLGIPVAQHLSDPNRLFVMVHDVMFAGPWHTIFRASGMVPGSRKTTVALLRTGHTVIAFPGGDYDLFRPTRKANTVDFGGRTGYVRAALDSGRPIIPAVTWGAHRSQYIPTRGEGIARALGLDRRFHMRYAPITFGLPFLVTLGIPPQLPLPLRTVTRFLDPVYVSAEFGPNPDPAVVDDEIQRRMQDALNELAAAQRRR